MAANTDCKCRACIASAMRIWFTLNIAAVIAEADVSWNGLFIGIWTTLEISLIFVVACSLCLPKLVQLKGRKYRVALSYASAPFSVNPGIVCRKTWTQEDLGPSASQGYQQPVRTSTWDDIKWDKEAPNCHGRAEHAVWKEDLYSRPRKPSPSLYRTSSAASSRDCSQSKTSKPSSPPQDGFRLQPPHTPEIFKQQQPCKSAFSP